LKRDADQQPITELDTRFTDQDAVPTDWEECRQADALNKQGFENHARGPAKGPLAVLVFYDLQNAM
jgi:hypothetical protein